MRNEDAALKSNVLLMDQGASIGRLLLSTFSAQASGSFMNAAPLYKMNITMVLIILLELLTSTGRLFDWHGIMVW